MRRLTPSPEVVAADAAPTQSSSWRAIGIRVLLSLPIATVALALAFRSVEATALRATLLAMRWSALGAAVACAPFVVGVRIIRWVVLVRAIAPIAVGEIARVGALGYMAIDLFPVRLGELVRPALLSARNPVPIGGVLATIVVERLLDLIAILTGLLAALWLAKLPGVMITIAGRPMDLAVEGRNAVLVLLFLLGTPVVTLLLAGEAGLRLLAIPARLLPEILATPLFRTARSFVEALRTIGQPMVLIKALGLTALVWLLVDAVSFAIIRAVQLDQIDAAQATLVMVVMSLALLLPSPVGGLGVFEAGGVAGLSLFGVAPAPAAAYAIAVHAIHVGTVVVIGALVLARDGVRWRELWQAGAGPPA